MRIKGRHLIAVVSLLAMSCGGGAGGGTRTILVDWSHDEFASYFIANFPTKVAVTPGTRLVFRQTWTGEPHTVTGGTLADEMGEVVVPLLEEWGDTPDEDVPPEVFEQFEAATADLVWAFGEEDDLNQTAAQPCYLDSGRPPADGQPCETREQPEAFTGRQAYYNSGIIPYEGPSGNTFEVQLSDDIEPGTYTFYCAVHGPFQRTQVEVRPEGSDVPSADEVARQAREQIRESAEPLLETFREATTRNRVALREATAEGPFAGLHNDNVTDADINEFVPRRMRVEANEPITWKMMGADHSISFNVPEYFPIVEFLEDGTVRLNPRLQPPAGGAPEYSPDEGEEETAPPTEDEEPAEAAAPPPEAGPGEPPKFDAGIWDGGQEFWSSGLISGDPWLEYTLRISRPGTYEYACLLHPPMVGTIEVTA